MCLCECLSVGCWRGRIAVTRIELLLHTLLLLPLASSSAASAIRVIMIHHRNHCNTGISSTGTTFSLLITHRYTQCCSSLLFFHPSSSLPPESSFSQMNSLRAHCRLSLTLCLWVFLSPRSSLQSLTHRVGCPLSLDRHRVRTARDPS